MAEEQVIPRKLVLDNNRDKLVKMIGGVKLASKEELLTRQKSAFCNQFLCLCHQYFGLRNHDVYSLLKERKESKEKLLVLEFEVFKRAERRYKFIKYIFLPLCWVPFIGWSVATSILNKDVVNSPLIFDSPYYCKLRRILIEKYGENFFPFETLRQELHNKHNVGKTQ